MLGVFVGFGLVFAAWLGLRDEVCHVWVCARNRIKQTKK